MSRYCAIIRTKEFSQQYFRQAPAAVPKNNQEKYAFHEQVQIHNKSKFAQRKEISNFFSAKEKQHIQYQWDYEQKEIYEKQSHAPK
eukprot:403366266